MRLCTSSLALCYEKGAEHVDEKKIDVSEWLSMFLQNMDQYAKDYEWAVQEETRLERLTQDYLHLLELAELDYHGRAKLAAKLREHRIQRRAAKDTVIVLEPIVEFLNSERGKLLIGQLQQVLGKVRKAEKYIDQRTYTPKVLERDVFESVNKS